MPKSAATDYPKWELLAYFCFSVVLNSFGNALTVAMNLGSALWTASAVNLVDVVPLSLSWLLFLEGFIVIIVNICILKRFELNRIIGNLIFMVPFSYFVQLFAAALMPLAAMLPLWGKIGADCLGVCFIGVAISLYQRVNWWMHPVDDFCQIIRFKWLGGSAFIAQLATFTPPLIVLGLCFLKLHALNAVNVGTIFALFCQGMVVGWADCHIFPHLKHRSQMKQTN